MLSQQEGQEHQHASVVDNPPHIDVAFGEALAVGRVAGDVLGNQQGHTGHSRLSNHLCKDIEALICYYFSGDGFNCISIFIMSGTQGYWNIEVNAIISLFHP